MIQNSRTGNLRQGFCYDKHHVDVTPVLSGGSSAPRNFKRTMRSHTAIMEQSRQYAQILEEYKQNALSLSIRNKDLEKRLENEAIQKENLASSLEIIKHELDVSQKSLEQEAKMKEVLFNKIGSLEKELYRMHQKKYEIIKVAKENAQLQRSETVPVVSEAGNSTNFRNLNRSATVGSNRECRVQLLQKDRISFSQQCRDANVDAWEIETQKRNFFSRLLDAFSWTKCTVE